MDVFKAVLKTVKTKLIFLLIPIAFILGLAIALGGIGDSSSNSSASSGDDGFSETSGSAYEQFKKWNRGWEAGDGAKTNSAGTKYIVVDDGYGHPTVGYGVDIYNSGYKDKFVKAGYNINYRS